MCSIIEYCNVNVYVCMVGHMWLPKQKHPSWSIGIKVFLASLGGGALHLDHNYELMYEPRTNLLRITMGQVLLSHVRDGPFESLE